MATESITTFLQARKACADVLERVAAIEEQYTRLEAHKAKLVNLPMEDASPYWNEGKYLYLIGRSINGRRERRYVGVQPKRVEEAIRSVSNFKAYQQAEKCIQQLRNKMSEIVFVQKQVLRELRFGSIAALIDDSEELI